MVTPKEGQSEGGGGAAAAAAAVTEVGGQQMRSPVHRVSDATMMSHLVKQEWTAAPSGDRTLEPAFVTRLRTAAVEDYR